MDDFEKRTSRIVGQIRGISKMIKEGRNCESILQQVAAVKKAIDGLTVELIIREVSPDIPEAKKEVLKKMIDRAIQL
jgi:DNA-binding FrmR family transcriptional regulator